MDVHISARRPTPAHGCQEITPSHCTSHRQCCTVLHLLPAAMRPCVDVPHICVILQLHLHHSL
jgi:hypothetical protein